MPDGRKTAHRVPLPLATVAAAVADRFIAATNKWTANCVTPYPSAWMLMVLDYRCDLMHLSQQIRCFSQSAASARQRHLETSINSFTETLIKLVRKAERVNDTCPPILEVLSLCALPMACSCMFVATYAEGDTVYVGYFYLLICGSYMTFNFSLQFIAGAATYESDVVVRELTGFACREAHVPVKQHRLLLQLIEVIGSEGQPLAMQTIVGEPYTLTNFLEYLIEVFMEFTLLQTFSGFLMSVES